MRGIRGTGVGVAVGLLLISCLAVAVSAGDSMWIVQSDLAPEELPATAEASHALLLKLLSKKAPHQLMFELRNEFYTLATGKDFYRLAADDGQNREYHAVAEAALRLWQRLPHMATLSGVLRAAIVNGSRTAQARGDIAQGLPAIRDTIEKLLAAQSPALFDEYRRLKDEALAKAAPSAAADYKIYYYEIPKTVADAKKIVASSLNEPYLKRLMVHSSFGNETRRQSASSESAYLVAASVLELSKSAEYGAKAQALYDEAVDEIARGIEDVDADDVSEKHLRKTFVEIGAKFSKTLADKFESDPTLKAKLEETKQQLLSKSRR